MIFQIGPKIAKHQNPITGSESNFKEEVTNQFDPEAYTGHWFEIAKTPTGDPHQDHCHAATADYTYDPDQGTIEVLNTCYSKWKSERQVVFEPSFKIYGTAVPSKEQGVFHLTFQEYYAREQEKDSWVPIPVPEKATRPALYIVYETDYENYSLVGCKGQSCFYYLQRHRHFCDKQRAWLCEKMEHYGFNPELTMVQEDIFDL